jgi:lipoprotein-releasing system permease protein
VRLTLKSVVLTIARRFVWADAHGDQEVARGFVSFISMISVAGLALGVTALLVVTSVMNGFEKELKGALTSFHGHVILYSRGEPIGRPDRYVDEIKSKYRSVVAVSPYAFSEVMVGSRAGVSGAVLEGVDMATFSQVSRIPSRLVEGRMPQDRGDAPVELALGKELARKLSLKVGDQATVIVPFIEGQGQPFSEPAVVVGIVNLGLHDYDSKYALADLRAVQNALKLEDKVNAFKILTQDSERSEALAGALNDYYVYPMRARDWSSLNRNLFYAIKLEKVVIAIILMAIILVASFNVISTIMMIVNEKQRQVSMLKAIGFRPKQTFTLFWIIGGGMAVMGAFLGLVFARALCELLRWKSIIDLPADIYMFNRLPVEVRGFEWAVIVGASVALALLAVTGPCASISRKKPAEGMRYES